jgi:hypothetical protein
LKARLCRSVITRFVLAHAAVVAQTPASLTVSPDKLTFSKTPVGSQSAPLSVTLTNVTKAPVQLEDLVVSGIDFSQANNCGKELAANASCSIQITFRPAIPGDRLGSLEVVGSGSNAAQLIALDGVGE